MIVVLDKEGKVELINRKGAEVLGYEESEIAGRDWFRNFLPPDGRREVRSVFKDIMRGKLQVMARYENDVLTRSGETRTIQWHNTALENEDGELIGTLSSGLDITEQRQAEQRLARLTDLERLIAGISTRFVDFAPDEVDGGISAALESLGKFMGVDRSYIFLRSEDKTTMRNAYEWAADGIELKSNEIQDMPVDRFPWISSKVREGEIVRVVTPKDLPPEASAERDEFQSEEIQSLLIVPLVCRSSALGVLGFDSVWKEITWEEEVVSLVKTAGEIFASALDRRRIEEELRYRIEFDGLITSISARFVSVRPEKIDDAIETALRELAEFADVDHCYLFQSFDDTKTVERTHYWSSAGKDSLHPDRMKLPYDKLPWGFHKLRRLEPVQILSVDCLPPDATYSRQYMETHGIRSLISVPFTHGDKSLGFIGLSSEREEHKWPDEMISLLGIVGEVFAGALQHKKRPAKK